MAFTYVKTTAKERKFKRDQRMMESYLVAHRNWEHKETIKGMAPQLVVYKKCIDVAPNVNSIVQCCAGNIYRVGGRGNLICVGRKPRR